MCTYRSAWGTAAALLLASGAMLHPEVAHAAVRVVTTCDDSGPGSLREALRIAAWRGDTIDLRGLKCGRIALSNGALGLPGGGVTLLGPGKDRLTIDAGGRSGIFRSTSESGPVLIRSMTLANGVADAGGCVRAEGNVELRHMRIRHCRARGPGGGGWTLGKVLLAESVVIDNVASGEPEFDGSGGGVKAFGGLVVYRSRIERNHAAMEGGGASGTNVVVMYSTIRDNTAGGSGGGLDSEGSLHVDRSTIAGNRANGGGGALWTGGPTRILNSTISGNRSSGGMGMVVLWGGDATIANSTVVGNSSEAPADDWPLPPRCGAAIEAVAVDGQPFLLRLASNIVAKNGCFMAGALDIHGIAEDGVRVMGVANLIGRSDLRLPPDTLCLDPGLGQLALNGGPTPTHALLPGSPAIDRGANVLDRAYDQRGPGFPRVKGARADIGAYEF